MSSLRRATVVLGIVVSTLVPGVADARVLTGTSEARPSAVTAPDQSDPVPLDPVEMACGGATITTTTAPGRHWQTAVVDPIRRLPPDWAPADLVGIPDLGYRGTEVATVREIVVDDLRAMHDAATAAHAPFVVVSGFRSEAQQAALYRAEVKRAARGHEPTTDSAPTGPAVPDGPTPTPTPSVPTTGPGPTPAPSSVAPPSVAPSSVASPSAAPTPGAPSGVATTGSASASPRADGPTGSTTGAGTDETPTDATAPGTARPGHSEHQLGTTIDVVDPSLPDLVPGLADTPAGRWLAVHAMEYGFVVSYQDGASDRTCFKPEPWHLRYVGIPTARALAGTDLTLREFLLTR